MSNYDRANPLLSALTRAGTAVSALGGVVAYLLTSGIVTAAQGEALNAAVAEAQQGVAHVSGVVAGIIAIIAGLSAAFGTVQVGKQGTTPSADPKASDGTKLVRADGVPVLVDPQIDGQG